MDDEALRLMREHMNRLRGRLFGFVEAIGLPDQQTDACKALIRTLTYDMQADLEAALRGS